MGAPGILAGGGLALGWFHPAAQPVSASAGEQSPIHPSPSPACVPFPSPTKNSLGLVTQDRKGASGVAEGGVMAPGGPHALWPELWTRASLLRLVCTALLAPPRSASCTAWTQVCRAFGTCRDTQGHVFADPFPPGVQGMGPWGRAPAGVGGLRGRLGPPPALLGPHPGVGVGRTGPGPLRADELHRVHL